MAEYVLYCFDGSRLVRCERFRAENDSAAIARSLQLQGTNAAELWCGPHRVKIFGSRQAA